MRRDNTQPVSGQLLVADYLSAFINAATSEAAKYEAERSENALLQQLGTMGNGGYLNPGNVAGGIQTDVARGSLDAHIKKIQAQQLDSMSAIELQRMIEQDKAAYVGRKVRVNVGRAFRGAVEALWFNQRTGYRNSTLHRSTLIGTIQEVMLEKNLLLLRPTFYRRLLIPELHNYVVYIIDPDTLQPMVDITLL